MRAFNKLVFVSIISALPLTDACAQEAAAVVPAVQDTGQRMCQQEDMRGHTFQMVEFDETPAGKETRAYGHFRYNYLTFFPDSSFNEVMSNRQFKSPEQLNNAYNGFRKSLKIYTLSKDGVLNLIRDDRILYSYRCIAILKPKNEFIPGDLVLTGYTRKAISKVFKVYRRWY